MGSPSLVEHSDHWCMDPLSFRTEDAHQREASINAFAEYEAKRGLPQESKSRACLLPWIPDRLSPVLTHSLRPSQNRLLLTSQEINSGPCPPG